MGAWFTSTREKVFRTTAIPKSGKPSSKMTDDKKDNKVDLGLLEEDDEFEEFPAEEWNEDKEEKKEVVVWEDNWDDDTVEDDFSDQLRAELESQGNKMEQ